MKIKNLKRMCFQAFSFLLFMFFIHASIITPFYQDVTSSYSFEKINGEEESENDSEDELEDKVEGFYVQESTDYHYSLNSSYQDERFKIEENYLSIFSPPPELA